VGGRGGDAPRLSVSSVGSVEPVALHAPGARLDGRMLKNVEILQPIFATDAWLAARSRSSAAR
jgi:hypothetical protein